MNKYEKTYAKWLEKHGSPEAVKAWLASIGSKGGKAKVATKGFGSKKYYRTKKVIDIS